MKKLIKKVLGIKTEFNSVFYWENRYKKGGNSGCGSYAEHAEFKAKTINDFIFKNQIKTLIEFGSGDGNQLKLFKIEKYIGLDTSPTAIKICTELYQNDKSKSFFIYHPKLFIDNNHIYNCDLSISLDVIYHILEDDLYQKYMMDLFCSSTKYVIIYSANKNLQVQEHVKYREFAKDVENFFPNFKLIDIVKSPFKDNDDIDFYFYEKINA